MDPQGRWRPLPTQGLAVDADPRLVRQLLGAVVTSKRGELGGHRFQQMQKVSRTEAVVRFEVKTFGRDLATAERVVLDDEGLRFEQVTGYLGAVEELIAIRPSGAATELAYSGRYQPRATFLGRLVGPLLVPMIYRREIRKTLTATKVLAEARQARSVVFRRGR